MTQDNGRNLAIGQIVDLIKASAAEDADPGEFLQELQTEIEQLPGASVSFASRDISWLRDFGYLEDRAVMEPAGLQGLIFEAASRFEDGSATQDHITALMEDSLDAAAPRTGDVEP